jgi:cell division protein FtsQ
MNRSRAAGSIVPKVAAWLAALALVAAPVVGVVNGWFAADRWPFTALRIDANFERVTAAQVRGAVLPHLSAGFFAIDLDAVRADIEKLPWVANAEVRKRWPDRLEVRVRERHAVARWGDDRLLDADAEVFAVPDAMLPDGLPWLDGPDARAAEVLAFHREIERMMADTALQPARLALSERGGWVLGLSSGAEIRIGRDAPHERLDRFVDTLRRASSASGATLARADLRYANGFAVEWQAPAPPSTPAAQPAPTSIPVAPPATPGIATGEPADATSPAGIQNDQA